jgi:hypothetical protein
MDGREPDPPQSKQDEGNSAGKPNPGELHSDPAVNVELDARQASGVRVNMYPRRSAGGDVPAAMSGELTT